MTGFLIDPKGFWIRKSLEEAAEKAVAGEDVSISEYIEDAITKTDSDVDADEHLNGLSYNQRRWLEREWGYAFGKASMSVKKQMKSLTPEQRKMIRTDVDSLLDTDKVKLIQHQRKALAEIRADENHSEKAPLGHAE